MIVYLSFNWIHIIKAVLDCKIIYIYIYIYIYVCVCVCVCVCVFSTERATDTYREPDSPV